MCNFNKNYSYHMLFFWILMWWVTGMMIVFVGSGERSHFYFQWLALYSFLITKSAYGITIWNCPYCSIFCSVSCISYMLWRKRCANLSVREAAMNLCNLETYKGKGLKEDAAESTDFIFELNLTLKELCAKNLNYWISQYGCIDCR